MDMERKGTIVRVLAFLAIVAALFGIVCGVAYTYKTTEAVGEVAGRKITVNEFVFVLKSVRNTFEQSMLSQDAKKEEIESFWNSVEGGKTARERADDIALDEAKRIKIQLIRAKGNNIELTKDEKEDIQKEINEAIEKLGGEKKAADRIRMVYGVSLKEYKKIREDMSLVDKYAKFEKDKINVNDYELMEYYNNNYENKDQVTVRHILISTVDTQGQQLPDDKYQEAQNLANDLVDRVKDGEDFGALVKEYSRDVSSKETKGQYTFRKGQMVPEFEAWAFNSKPGDIDIVKTDYGFHVMKKPTFDELKEDVKKGVVSEKYQQMLEEWSRVEIYNIKVNAKALKKAKMIAEE